MTDEQIDMIYRSVDFFFKRGCFAIVDLSIGTALYIMLRDKSYDKDLLISLLTTTLPAKSKLQLRSELVIEARKYLTEDEIKGLE